MDAMKRYSVGINKGEQLGGCKAFDVAMQKPCCLYSAFKFKNNHSYSISVLFQCGESWEVVIGDYELMSNPHALDRGSEAWTILPRHIWKHKEVTCSKKHNMRVIMKQPSPHWKQFGVYNFQLVNDNSSKTLSTEPT